MSLNNVENFSATAVALRWIYNNLEKSEKGSILGSAAARLIGTPISGITTLFFDVIYHGQMAFLKSLTGTVVSPYNFVARIVSETAGRNDDYTLSSAFVHITQMMHAVGNCITLPILVFLSPAKAYASTNSHERLSELQHELEESIKELKKQTDQLLLLKQIEINKYHKADDNIIDSVALNVEEKQQELNLPIQSEEKFSFTAHFLTRINGLETSDSYVILKKISARVIGVPGTIVTLFMDTIAHSSLTTAKLMTGVIVTPYNLLAKSIKPIVSLPLASDRLTLSSSFFHFTRIVHIATDFVTLPILVFLNPTKAYAYASSYQQLDQVSKDLQDTQRHLSQIEKDIKTAQERIKQLEAQIRQASTQEIGTVQTIPLPDDTWEEVNPGVPVIEGELSKSTLEAMANLPSPFPLDDTFFNESQKKLETTLADDQASNIADIEISNSQINLDMSKQILQKLNQLKGADQSSVKSIVSSPVLKTFLQQLERRDVKARVKLRALKPQVENLIETLQTCVVKIQRKEQIDIAQTIEEEDVCLNEIDPSFKEALETETAKDPAELLKLLDQRISYYENFLEEISKYNKMTANKMKAGIQGRVEHDAFIHEENMKKLKNERRKDVQALLKDLDATFPTSNVKLRRLNIELTSKINNGCYTRKYKITVDNLETRIEEMKESLNLKLTQVDSFDKEEKFKEPILTQTEKELYEALLDLVRTVKQSN